jgi:hypothetical protein
MTFGSPVFLVFPHESFERRDASRGQRIDIGHGTEPIRARFEQNSGSSARAGNEIELFLG